MMRKTLIGLGVAAMAFSGGALQARETGEEQLAKMLEGRVAGEPVSCISTFRNGNFTIIDETALVYRLGNTLYVNRTARPKSLDRDDVLVIEKTSASQLCKLDHVSTVDRGSGFMTGIIFLEDFVPYKLPEQAD